MLYILFSYKNQLSNSGITELAVMEVAGFERLLTTKETETLELLEH